MDLKQYFSDLRATEAELLKNHPNRVVYVTSVFYRERNSTPGDTASATPSNAARVITDGTHREATEAEVKNFLAHQQQELEKNVRAEQQKKQQYVVVTGGTNTLQPVNATVLPGTKGVLPLGEED